MMETGESAPLLSPDWFPLESRAKPVDSRSQGQHLVGAFVEEGLGEKQWPE